MSNKQTISTQFTRDDSDRANTLETARLCARLTQPGILPPLGLAKGERVMTNYQSIGSRGTSNIEGRMLLSLFPVDQFWFLLAPEHEVELASNVPNEQKQIIRNGLYMLQVLASALIESGDVEADYNRRRPQGFRSHKRMTISQFLITGDALEMMDDDYVLRLFRRDKYVTRRDSSGDVLYHITVEDIDPIDKLTDEQIVVSGLNRSHLEAKDAAERMQPLHTRCQWNPYSRVWVVEQECNGKIINTSEDKYTRYFSTPYRLFPGENYGRGLVEENLGDLAGIDELEMRMLDYAGMASKFTPVIDPSETIRDEDLAKPSGQPIRGRVVGGQTQGIAFLQANKTADIAVTEQFLRRKTTELGKAFLMDSEAMPRGERVTRAQVNRVAMELDAALGGAYAPVAEAQQLPLIQRVMYQMQRDRIAPALKPRDVRIRTLTGIAALSRQMQQVSVMALVSQIAALGPEALARVNIDVLIDMIARTMLDHEPGLIKTREEMRQEIEQQMRDQTRMAANQQAIQSAGAIAENAAAAAAAPSI